MRCVLTFIDVGREASDEDLPGVALHPLSILAASGRVQAGSQGRVSVAVVEEAILERKKTGATWEERARVEEGRERRREKGGEGGKETEKRARELRSSQLAQTSANPSERRQEKERWAA